MRDAAHGVKWLMAAALGMSLVTVHPSLSKADNPGHSIADRFATDSERAEHRKRTEKARRDADRTRREADQRRNEEADMLSRARAEAEARRAEQELRRLEAESAEQTRSADAERASAEERRRADVEAERVRRDAEAEQARRLAEIERNEAERRAAEARQLAEAQRLEAERAEAERRLAAAAAQASAEQERRRMAEAERAAAEAAREADRRRAEELAREAEQRRQAEAEQRRLAEVERTAAEARRAEDERRAAMAAERDAEASRITEALKAAEAHRLARERAREAARVAGQEAAQKPEASNPPAVAGGHDLPAPAAGSAGLGAPVLAAGQRYTVLLLMEPGNRGIRRHNKTADPVLCGSEGCYVSNGPDQSATQMRPNKALGFFRTWGERAGACSNSLGCVFRDVDLGALPGWLQPVDMRVVRHDRRQGMEVTAASDCWLEAGRLQCRGVDGGNYVMWIVPERMAAEAGPALLARALDEGLPAPRQASLR